MALTDHYLSSIMQTGTLEKRSPGGRRKSIGGLFGKAFKLRSGGGGGQGRKDCHMPAVVAGGIPDV